MSKRRLTNTPCPIDGPVTPDVCQACRYFRGMSSSNHERRGWDVNCNYPRDGAYVHKTEVPAIFLAAFEDVA
jgi:hypothetical protein